MGDHHAPAAHEVARGVLRDLDVEAVLERVLESARELTSARYAAFGVLDETGRSLARFVTLGIDAETRRAIGSLPTGHGVLGELISHPQPLRVANLGAHPRSYGLPDAHPPMRTFLGVPVLVDAQPFGNIYVTEKHDGEQFTKEDEAALVMLAELAGLAIDHAQRFTASETKRTDVERAVAALDASIQISRALGGETDVQAVLGLVAKRGRALVAARAFVIEALDGDYLEIAVGAGEVPAGVIGKRILVKDTVASIAMRTGESQRVEVDLNRARFRDYGLGHLGFPASLGLIVPLIHRGVSHGVLVAIDRDDGAAEFTANDQSLLESFAASAASAVAAARFATGEQHRQRLAAAEEERSRWARELHDETLQSLASLRLILGVAQRTPNRADVDNTITASISHIDSAITTLRSLITDLRPAALEELGTEAAIRALAERASQHGLDVNLDIDLAYEQHRHPERHTTEVEIAIYRIIQEALTNARKHGAAKHATIAITDDETTIGIAIHDDGKGFDPAHKTNGYGLLGMRERTDLVNGTLEVTSTPHEGTTITATIPTRRRPSTEEQSHASKIRSQAIAT